MNCPICHTGTTRPGRGDKALTRDGTTVVVEQVPAEVCDTCGEWFFDADVVRDVVQLTREATAARVVDIRRYPTAARGQPERNGGRRRASRTISRCLQIRSQS